jgi:hypothetical protein
LPVLDVDCAGVRYLPTDGIKQGAPKGALFARCSSRGTREQNDA